MASPQGFLSEEHQQRWVRATYSIRACELALDGAVDPIPASLLACADALYPWEKVSAWSHNYLCAGIEHMLLWADLVAPYSFDEAHVIMCDTGRTCSWAGPVLSLEHMRSGCWPMLTTHVSACVGYCG